MTKVASSSLTKIPMRFFIAATLLLSGLIHLLPCVGLAGASRLTALYGIAVDEPNLEILMRHRAVLFGLLGVFLILAAFRPAFQLSAFALGLVSVLSFLALAWSAGSYNAQVARVVVVDLAAAGLLIAGCAAWLFMELGSKS